MGYKEKGAKSCTQSDGSKGSYKTVKKDGTTRCYKSEKNYKAAMAWGHGEADEPDGELLEEIEERIRENLLRLYIKNILLKT